MEQNEILDVMRIMLDTVDDVAFTKSRREMVEKQVLSRGVRAPRVLEAMRKVPREAFLPQSLREFAYDDAPLPIEANQTISQPYIVAFMIEALNLKGGEAILEIGTGSGYAAAVLSRIAAHVYSVERIAQLAEKAATVLSDLHYENVLVRHGDGTEGWPEYAPYDAIVVAAGGPAVPEALKRQLRIGGRLVIPVGKDQRIQELVRVTRLSEEKYKTAHIADVRFVPLIGKEGWSPKEGEIQIAGQSRSTCSSFAASFAKRWSGFGARIKAPYIMPGLEQNCAPSPRPMKATRITIL